MGSLMHTPTHALSPNSVWDGCRGSVEDTPPPKGHPRAASSLGPARGVPEGGSRPLTTTASSQNTIDGSPVFAETPTPPAKDRFLKSAAVHLQLPNQRLGIARIAEQLNATRNKLGNHLERRSAASSCSKS